MSIYIKDVAVGSPFEVRYFGVQAWNTMFGNGEIFHPPSLSARDAGNDLHASLQFGHSKEWIAPMVDRYRRVLGNAALGNRSEFPLSLRGEIKGKADWLKVTRDAVFLREFKWVQSGLPLKPREEDVLQTALYALCAKMLYPWKRVHAAIDYFYGGSSEERAGIRTFRSKYESQLLGIANAVLQLN